jgi:hypothetical protein
MRKLRLYLDTSVFGGVIKNYNSVNMQNGFKSLDIRSPKEVIYD